MFTMETRHPRLRCDYYNADGTAYDLVPCRSIAGGWQCRYAHPDDPDWASSQQTWKAQRRPPDEQHRVRPPSPPRPPPPLSTTPSMIPSDPRKRPPPSAIPTQPPPPSTATAIPSPAAPPPPSTPTIKTSDPSQLLAIYQQYALECKKLEHLRTQHTRLSKLNPRLTDEVKALQQTRMRELDQKLRQANTARDTVKKRIVELDAWPNPVDSPAEQELASALLRIRQETEALEKGVADSSASASNAVHQQAKQQEKLALGKRRRESVDDGNRIPSALSAAMARLEEVERMSEDVDTDRHYYAEELKEAMNEMIQHNQQKIQLFKSMSLPQNSIDAVDGRLQTLQERIDGTQERSDKLYSDQTLLEGKNIDMNLSNETRSEWASLLQNLQQFDHNSQQSTDIVSLTQSLHEYHTKPPTPPSSPLPPDLLFGLHEDAVREMIQNKVQNDLERLRSNVEPMLESHQQEIQKSVWEKIDLTRRAVDVIFARVHAGAAGIVPPQ